MTLTRLGELLIALGAFVFTTTLLATWRKAGAPRPIYDLDGIDTFGDDRPSSHSHALWAEFDRVTGRPYDQESGS